jgi:hypothetical protein
VLGDRRGHGDDAVRASQRPAAERLVAARPARQREVDGDDERPPDGPRREDRRQAIALVGGVDVHERGIGRAQRRGQAPHGGRAREARQARDPRHPRPRGRQPSRCLRAGLIADDREELALRRELGDERREVDLRAPEPDRVGDEHDRAQAATSRHYVQGSGRPGWPAREATCPRRPLS